LQVHDYAAQLEAAHLLIARATVSRSPLQRRTVIQLPLLLTKLSEQPLGNYTQINNFIIRLSALIIL
jgi:hypothetical protein